jgi:tight adherence protein C
LSDRVAPYLLDVSEEARLVVARRTVHPLPLFGAFLGPTVEGLWRGFVDLLGGGSMIALRLRQAGIRRGVDEFRGRQLAWAALGLAAGAVAVVITMTIRPLPLAVIVGIPGVSAIAAFVGRDRLLARRARQRVRRIATEFPTVIEFMTLSLSAGEGILEAIRRVARVGSGELPAEFREVIAIVNTGIPLAGALNGLARGLQIPSVTRWVDAVVGALERGAPLAEVLRAQAADARTEAKRELLESAGKKEVAMLVPNTMAKTHL